MTFSRILIANRGEVAVRVIRTASEMGIETVAIYSQDDAASLHISLADVAVPLEGSGAAAYLDGAGIIELAREHSCQAIHPGWGFLSENAGFAELCGQAGITFIGPTPAVLATLGDKAHARLLAADCGVPILDGIDAAVSIDEARAFLRQRGPGGAMIIKAVAGGGGRGMRVVRDEAALESAYRRCQSEALNAFGNASVYVEELFPRARHVEVQVIGDGTGNVSHLWERDCSIQRSHQKVVEIAPSPGLHPAVRARLTSDAVRMASRLNYRGLGTFEFLVDADTAATDPGARYAFIEANARLQVEHTITEEVCGLGITTGRCFAGNASLLGCCDVIIATSDANIGMGGPAMVEGGGLGVFAPEEIGPMSVQVPNGVVDIAVRDEKEGVEVARKYLGYFQGPIRDWTARDQRELRHIVPENRLRVYDPQVLLETLCDEGSVLELRKHFGQGMYTAFGRIEGRPIGIVGNDPRFVGGAITSDGSDKAARFMQLCDAFDIPLLFLCDTPGMMVGPEVEKTALVRHCSRMFVIGANVSVPCMTIVVRKAYGLGALAMAAGSFKAPLFTISWPTGEYGGMGLEGSVKLGYRNELAAIADPDERKRVFDEMVADAYERGKALNEATVFGVDDVIDPADSRRWVSTMLESVRTEPRGKAKKRMAVDTW